MHFTLSLMTVKCVWMFLAGLRGVGCPLWPVSAVSVVISQETSAESAGDRGTSGESGEREREMVIAGTCIPSHRTPAAIIKAYFSSSR